MKIRSRFVTFLLITPIVSLIAVNSALAIDPAQAAVWDRSEARDAISSVNTDMAAGEIRNLKDIEALEQRSDWPLPAREATMYKFTQSLATLQRDAVAVDIMQHLRSYQARVLVSHEDHGDAFVPLFNIRGAAAGVENGWLRSESAAEAQILLETTPAELPAEYLKSSNVSQKSGYLDAIRHSDNDSVRAVQSAALDQLSESPSLTRLVAETARITADPYAIQRLLTDGSGSGLASALEDIGAQTSPAETAALLDYAIKQAPAANAALAVAAWWPVLRNNPETRQLLIDKLSDPELGSAIALALARNPDIQTIRELQLVAAGDSLAAQRAQLALNINHDGLIHEVQK